MMSNQSTGESKPSRRMVDAAAYSAHIQEAMRYNRLSSTEYSLAMNIMNAVLHGYTEEQWKEEYQRSLKPLLEREPDQKLLHADAANRYEQVVSSLKDLALWPWP